MDKVASSAEAAKSTEASAPKPPTPQPPVYFKDAEVPFVTFRRSGKEDRLDNKSDITVRSKASSRSTRSAKREAAARMAELQIIRRSMEASNQIR